MKLSSILSIRNILRASGVVAITVGTPMVVIPPLVVQAFFGKREDSSEPDKKALELTMQALGVALTASGAKSVMAPVSKHALGSALYMEAMYSCYHACNRFGRMKDAKGNVKTTTVFLCANLTLVFIQALSLLCGDEPEEKEE